MAAASMTIDLLTKPLKRGNAEIDAAPTMQNIQVRGMVLYNPPRAVPFIFPVRYITAPMAMKRRALKRISLKTSNNPLIIWQDSVNFLNFTN